MVCLKRFRASVLFVGLVLVIGLFVGIQIVSSAESNDQFLQGAWAFEVVEFPGFQFFCEFTADILGTKIGGNFLCSMADFVFPTEEGVWVVSGPVVGAWEKIGDSEFRFRDERVVITEDRQIAPGVKFLDWGIYRVDGSSLKASVQGAFVDLDGNLLVLLPPLTLKAQRISAEAPEFE